MKGYMHGWGILARVLGVLVILAGVATFVLSQAQAGNAAASLIANGIGLLVFGSICDWMDDVWETLHDNGEKVNSMIEWAKSIENKRTPKADGDQAEGRMEKTSNPVDSWLNDRK